MHGMFDLERDRTSVLPRTATTSSMSERDLRIALHCDDPDACRTKEVPNCVASDKDRSLGNVLRSPGQEHILMQLSDTQFCCA